MFAKELPSRSLLVSCAVATLVLGTAISLGIAGQTDKGKKNLAENLTATVELVATPIPDSNVPAVLSADAKQEPAIEQGTPVSESATLQEPAALPIARTMNVVLQVGEAPLAVEPSDDADVDISDVAPEPVEDADAEAPIPDEPTPGASSNPVTVEDCLRGKSRYDVVSFVNGKLVVKTHNPDRQQVQSDIKASLAECQLTRAQLPTDYEIHLIPRDDFVACVPPPVTCCPPVQQVCCPQPRKSCCATTRCRTKRRSRLLGRICKR